MGKSEEGRSLATEKKDVSPERDFQNAPVPLTITRLKKKIKK